MAEVLMCGHYTVKDLRPWCKRGKRPGVKCHAENKTCPDYKPSDKEIP